MSNKVGKESLYIVSRPETGLDPPIGSDRESGCDIIIIILDTWFIFLHSGPFLPRNNLFLFISLYFK